MQKRKTYDNCRFPAELIRLANETLTRMGDPEGKSGANTTLEARIGGEEWSYDSLDEFLADYRRNPEHAKFSKMLRTEADWALNVYIYSSGATTVAVQAPDRASVLSLFDLFESAQESSRLPLPPPPPAPPPETPIVFIGHGRNKAWRELKDHLQDKHKIQVEAYEIGARAGHTVRDILGEMMTRSSFALLVLTGEDETADGGMRARQNVVHETGLFQGRLGFSRAIVLLEEGAEEFSNIHGIEQIRFSRGNIKETFGDVLAVLRREFPKSLS